MTAPHPHDTVFSTPCRVIVECSEEMLDRARELLASVETADHYIAETKRRVDLRVGARENPQTSRHVATLSGLRDGWPNATLQGPPARIEFKDKPLTADAPWRLLRADQEPRTLPVDRFVRAAAQHLAAAITDRLSEDEAHALRADLRAIATATHHEVIPGSDEILAMAPTPWSSFRVIRQNREAPPRPKNLARPAAQNRYPGQPVLALRQSSNQARCLWIMPVYEHADPNIAPLDLIRAIARRDELIGTTQPRRG